MCAQSTPAKICPTCGERYPRGQYCSRDGARLVDATSETVAATGPRQPDSSPRPDPLVGTTIAGRFEIIERLGQGGMGTVYRARHRFLGREVALKLLRPEVSDAPDVVARFEREALAAAKIGHPNIVHIEDCGRLDDGHVYLSMELLAGVPLSSAIQSESLSLSAAVEVAVEVCRGLGAAHGAGIVHRDMKADNVFLLPGGRVKILDFGIAKVSGSLIQTNLTQTGTVFGTPNYMSPEQALGKPVDLRSDIYSVGVMLYEMLTGKVPFVAETFMGVLTQHVTEAPPPPRARAPQREIPASLEAVVLRAMAKDPGARYPDAAAFEVALAALRKELGGEALAASVELQGLPPAAVSMPSSPTATAGELVGSTPVRERGKPRRWPWAVALLVLLVGGGLAAAFGFLPSPSGSAAGGAGPPPEAKVSSPERVKVVVASIPSGAEVWRAGKKVAVTPDVLWVTAGAELGIELRLAGYVSKALRVRGDKDRRLTLELKRSTGSGPKSKVGAPASRGVVEAEKPKKIAKKRLVRKKRGRAKVKRRKKPRRAPKKVPSRDHDHDHGGDDDHGP